MGEFGWHFKEWSISALGDTRKCEPERASVALSSRFHFCRESSSLCHLIATLGCSEKHSNLNTKFVRNSFLNRLFDRIYVGGWVEERDSANFNEVVI